jgi:Protein of unknown function (DUF3102)
MTDDNRPRTESPDVEQSLVLVKDTTKLINEKHREVERLNGEIDRSTATILALKIEIGELLNAEKERVPYGEWEGHVATNYDFGIDSAQNYMLLAREKPIAIGFPTARQALTHIKKEKRRAKSAAKAAKVVELRPSTTKSSNAPAIATTPPVQEETRSIPMTRALFGRIGNCLHPDRRPTKKERKDVHKMFEALWPREPSRSKLN